MQNPGFLQVARPVTEENDCAVRALANATGTPYAEAHSMFFDAGRRPNKGTPWSAVYGVYGRFGALTRYNRNYSATVGSFIAENPVGTFILSIRRHVFAVRDGVILDTGMCKPTTALLQTWKMHEHKPIAEFVPDEVLVTPNKGYRPLAFNVHALLAKVNSVRVANNQD